MSDNLKSTNYEEIIKNMGGSVDDLPDKLESTYLKRIAELAKKQNEVYYLTEEDIIIIDPAYEDNYAILRLNLKSNCYNVLRLSVLNSFYGKHFQQKVRLEFEIDCLNFNGKLIIPGTDDKYSPYGSGDHLYEISTVSFSFENSYLIESTFRANENIENVEGYVDYFTGLLQTRYYGLWFKDEPFSHFKRNLSINCNNGFISISASNAGEC